MMSEKERFVVSTNEIGEIIVTDTETGNVYRRDNISNFFGLIRLMNEQQATIKRLEEENDDLRFALRTEQAFARVEKDKKPFLSKEEFLKELEEDE